MLNEISGRIGFFAALLLSVAAFVNIPAFADDSTVPSETASEEEMKAFAEHARDELNKAQRGAGLSTAGETSALASRMRSPDGGWQNGSVYLISVRESVTAEDIPGLTTGEPKGQFQVINHGKHMDSLYGHYIGAIPLMNAAGETLGDLAKAAKADPNADAVCRKYKTSESGPDRWACAAAHETADGYGDVKYVVIAGFDHDENDGAIVKNQCATNTLITRTVLPVWAEDVNDKETLQSFVDGVVTISAPRLATVAPESREAQSADAICLSQSPWSHGSVYLFIMEGTTVITNANDPGLNGSVFENVFDEDGVDIWKLIKEAVESEAGGGFIEYKWDDPDDPDDDVTPRVAGKSPGTSPKVSYVKKFDLPDGRYLVFGSGIYPAETPPTTGSDDDGGCAIAGTGDRSRGALLNLLLTATVLFPAALLRKRS